jgi:pimeloyl-ACP methyl ester carboxylesterase
MLDSVRKRLKSAHVLALVAVAAIALSPASAAGASARGTPLASADACASGAQAADSNVVRLVVVLLRGVLSSSGDHSLSEMRDTLCAVDPEGMRVTYFSYRYPESAAYTACDTQQSVQASADRLNRQLQDLTSQYPRARLMLVGHSLGGAVASAWAAAEADESLLRRTASVVTFDSPLLGVPWLAPVSQLAAHLPAQWLPFGESLACLSGPLARELADPTAGDGASGTLAKLRSAPERLAAGGGAMFNVASCDDGIVWCATSLLPGAEHRIFHSGKCDDDALAALRTRWPVLDRFDGRQGWAELWSQVAPDGRLPSISLADVRLGLSCLRESHGRVVRDAEALAWLGSLGRSARLAAPALRTP